jgi:hypothetical protein
MSNFTSYATPYARAEERRYKKKYVRFTPDTILSDSDHIALTITRHSFIQDKGYTQYFIKVRIFRIKQCSCN